MEPRDAAATWETSTAGHMAMQEFAFQRMHRRPVPAPAPFASLCGNEPYATMNSTMYSASHHKEPPRVRVPSFTIGRKNDLGTSSHFRSGVTLDQLRLGQLHLGNEARTWETTSGRTHAMPQHDHPLQGASAPRSGLAPRMPFAEIDRRFGQLDSTGSMPGTYGERSLRSETMAQFPNPGPQPPVNPTLTLGTTNDIGSSTKYRKTPAMLADMTHYSLGNEPRRCVNGWERERSTPVDRPLAHSLACVTPPVPCACDAPSAPSPGALAPQRCASACSPPRGAAQDSD